MQRLNKEIEYEHESILKRLEVCGGMNVHCSTLEISVAASGVANAMGAIGRRPDVPTN